MTDLPIYAYDIMVVFLKALLCFHGLLSNHNDFAYIYNHLKPYYDKILCTDLPGHGTNQEKFTTENIKKYSLDLYDSLSQFEEIDVIGYSLGGLIACYLQKERKVHRLVLLAPAYRYLNLKNYHRNPSSKQGQLRMKQILPKKNYFHVFRFVGIVSKLNQEFETIEPETMILWGKDDYLVKEKSGYLLFQMTKNKGKSYIQLDNHNHFNIVHSKVVCSLIKDFLLA